MGSEEVRHFKLMQRVREERLADSCLDYQLLSVLTETFATSALFKHTHARHATPRHTTPRHATPSTAPHRTHLWSKGGGAVVFAVKHREKLQAWRWLQDRHGLASPCFLFVAAAFWVSHLYLYLFIYLLLLGRGRGRREGCCLRHAKRGSRFGRRRGDHGVANRRHRWESEGRKYSRHCGWGFVKSDPKEKR